MGSLHDLWSVWALSHLHRELPLKSVRVGLAWGYIYIYIHAQIHRCAQPQQECQSEYSLSEAVIPEAGQMNRLHSYSIKHSDLSLSIKRNKKPTAFAIFLCSHENCMISACFIQRGAFGMSCLQATWPHLGREEQQATTGVSKEICQPASQGAAIRIFVTNCHGAVLLIRMVIKGWVNPAEIQNTPPPMMSRFYAQDPCSNTPVFSQNVTVMLFN